MHCKNVLLCLCSFHVLFRKHREPIKARGCPLLVMWDGETTGRRRLASPCTTSCWFTGGKATSQNSRQYQPHHLSNCNSFYYWLLGMSKRSAAVFTYNLIYTVYLIVFVMHLNICTFHAFFFTTTNWSKQLEIFKL